jgi:hypothetical protein
MAIFTRNHREQRLVDELLTQAATIRDLRAAHAQLLTEARSWVDLAQESAGLGPTLKRAVDLYMQANADLEQIEARHGIQRPSRHAAPVQPDDFAALWRSALADPT